MITEMTDRFSPDRVPSFPAAADRGLQVEGAHVDGCLQTGAGDREKVAQAQRLRTDR